MYKTNINQYAAIFKSSKEPMSTATKCPATISKSWKSTNKHYPIIYQANEIDFYYSNPIWGV